MEEKMNISIPNDREIKNVQCKIVDGVIQVSYHIEPKKGDVLIDYEGKAFLYNGNNYGGQYGCSAYQSSEGKIEILESGSWMNKMRCHLASEKESSKFFERLRKECGKVLNPETKQLEDVKWTPEPEEKYWYVTEDLVVASAKYNNMNNLHISRIKSNNCFKTKEAAQKVADKIKEIFKNSKAE